MPVPKGLAQCMVTDLPAHTRTPAHDVYNLVRALPRHRLILLSYTVAAPALKYISSSLRPAINSRISAGGQRSAGWRNDGVCRIDTVLDGREAPSLKAGGQGMRYTCRVGEQQHYLFNDDMYWFVEL